MTLKTEDPKEWKGKFLRIRWSDGTVSDIPAQSKGHWRRLQAFAREEKQPLNDIKQERKKPSFEEWREQMRRKHHFERRR